MYPFPNEDSSIPVQEACVFHSVSRVASGQGSGADFRHTSPLKTRGKEPEEDIRANRPAWRPQAGLSGHSTVCILLRFHLRALCILKGPVLVI